MVSVTLLVTTSLHGTSGILEPVRIEKEGFRSTPWISHFSYPDLTVVVYSSRECYLKVWYDKLKSMALVAMNT